MHGSQGERPADTGALVFNDGERILGRVNGLLAARGALWIKVDARADGTVTVSPMSPEAAKALLSI